MTEISTNPIKTFSGGIFSKWLATLLLVFAGAIGARAQVTASFTASNMSICAPDAVNFDASSSTGPGTLTYRWTFGNGGFGSGVTSSTTYLNPGTYTVKLVVSNGTQQDSAFKNIVAFAKPAVSFVADDSSTSCAPKSVVFTGTVTNTPAVPGAIRYFWDFGNGNGAGITSVNTTVTQPYTYTTPGNYPVILTAINAAGCTTALQKTNYINVIASPVAAFSLGSVFSCNTALVSFNSIQSTGATFPNKWNFGDGTADSSVSVNSFIRSYSTPGTYTVRLVVTNGACNDTAYQTINATVGGTVANFTAPANVCVNAAATFTNTTTPDPFDPTVNFSWDFGDGGTSTDISPSYTYSAAGTYTVTLTSVRQSCTSTVSKNITVLDPPAASFTASAIASCTFPFPVTFTNTTTPGGAGTTYVWQIVDQSTGNPISPAPANPTSTNLTYNFTTNGIYQVFLTATNIAACSNTSVPTQIKVGSADINVIVTGNQCGGSRVFFKAIITGAPPAPPATRSITWNFGAAGGPGNPNPTTTTADTTSFVYANPGGYTLTVSATQGGCSATYTQPITIGTRVNSGFTVTPSGTVCLDSAINFSPNTPGPAGTKYIWTIQGVANFTVFGTQGPDTTYRIANTVAPFTNKSVTLVTNNDGCKDTTTLLNVLSGSGPRALFTYNAPNCANKLAIAFDGTSSLRETTYSWDFGDGSAPVPTANPTHTYANYGRYAVTLTVSDGTCSSKLTRFVPVLNNDTFFSINAPRKDTLCPNGSTILTLRDRTGIQAARWDFINTTTGLRDTTGNTGTTPLSRIFPNVGIYNVKLVTIDSLGCRDSLTQNAFINVRGVVANFVASPLVPCAGDSVTFTDISTMSAGGTTTSRTWTFGDGNTRSGNAPVVKHLYPALTGSYNVSLQVTDNFGCTDVETKIGYINPEQPNAALTVVGSLQRCVNESITFNNNSTGGASFVWLFGDGAQFATTQDTPVRHAYATPGSYNVKIVAISPGGCRDTSNGATTTNISIVGNPSFFTLNDSFAACPPLVGVRPAVRTTTPNGTIFNWSFGDGRTSTVRNPTVTYTLAGTFVIKLIATTPTGCTDSFSRTVTVDGPLVTFDYGLPLSGCTPLTVPFRLTNPDSAKIIYDLGDGTVDSTSLTSLNFTHTYDTLGRFVPTLVVIGTVGCNYAVIGNRVVNPDTIKVGTLSANFISSAINDTACAGTPVQFTDATISTAGVGTAWSWDFGDGTTANVQNPVKAFTNTTSSVITRNVRMIIFTSNCSDTITKAINIKPSPSITVTPSGTTTICTGTSVQLQVTPATGLTFQWTPTTSLNNATIPNPIASPTSLTTYQVVATNVFSCTDTDTVRVDVQSRPTVVTNNDTAICSSNSVQLNATGALSYTWTLTNGNPAPGLTPSPNIPNPVATPTATTSYLVIGSFGSGSCRDSDTVVITVNPNPSIIASPNVNICSGTSTQLSVSTTNVSPSAIYDWTPGAGLSDSTIANPVANPTVTTMYTVIVTNPGLCADTDSVLVRVRRSPVINAGPDQGLCVGESYTFAPIGLANRYEWNLPNGNPAPYLSSNSSPNPTVTRSNIPEAITYYAIGINFNGCRDTDTVVVTTYPGVTLTVSNDTTICAGVTIPLSASGAAAYRWTPTTWVTRPNTANPTVAPLVTTTYKVIATDVNGCRDSDSVVVTVLPSPDLTVGNNFNLCSGSTAQLNAVNNNSANTGPVIFDWSPATGLSNTAIANPTVSNLTAPVSYVITAVAPNGCADTAYQSVYPIPKPNVNATVSIPVVCYGAATNLNATGAASYQWSPNIGLTCTTCSNPNALANATTTYTVVGSTNGCSDTATVTVTVNPLPTVSVTPDTATICAGQSVQLNATGNAASYTWGPTAGLSSTTVANPVATPATTTIYRVTAKSAANCTATAQSVIIVNPKANVIAAADDTTICENDSTILRASGALSYSWYPSAGLSCTNCTDPVAHPIISTTYRVIGSGVALCDDTAYVHVTVIPKPDLTVVPSGIAICAGSSTTLTASSSATGTFNWTPSTGLSCTACSSPVASPTATTTYTVSFTSLATGCTVRQQTEVSVNPLPTVTAGPDRSICAGVPTPLKVFGASSYVWSPATGLSCTACNNPVATIYDSTTYVITGTDAFGCVNTDTLTLTTIPRDTITVTADTIICAGSSVRLRATGGTSYLWTPAFTLSNPRIANPTASPSQTTTYRVAVSNADCYTDTLSVTVQVVPIPVVNAGVDVNVVTGQSVTLNGSVPAEVVRYYWTPVDFLSCNDCLNPVVTPRNTITYTLHGLTTYGCEGTDSVSLFTRCGSSQIFMPNTFTPNGDGQNDRFYPRGNGLRTINSFRIYSRWGDLVYEAQNITLNDEVSGWDGIYKGQPLKPDTYVWILEGVCESNDPLTMNGDITIIR